MEDVRVERYKRALYRAEALYRRPARRCTDAVPSLRDRCAQLAQHRARRALHAGQSGSKQAMVTLGKIGL